MKYKPKTNLDALDIEQLEAMIQDTGTPREIWLYCTLRLSYLDSILSSHHREHPEVSREKKQLCKDARAQIPPELDW